MNLSEVKRSKIKYLNVKQFGFLETGEYFHLRDWVTFECDGNKVPALKMGYGTMPAVGDPVVFRSKTPAKEGMEPKCHWIGCEMNHISVLNDISKLRNYRFMERRAVTGGRMASKRAMFSTRVLWEGWNRWEVSLKWPESLYPLAVVTPYVRRWFEVEHDGDWIKLVSDIRDPEFRLNIDLQGYVEEEVLLEA